MSYVIQRNSKYKNHKVIIGGKKIADSKKEEKRLNELIFMEKAGIIKDLKTQVKYELQEAYEINGKKIRGISYIADFVYYDTGAKKWVIEDVKPSKDFQTEVYKIKKKLFEYKYKQEITEIY